MKLLLISLIALFSIGAQARECEVYGISDGPQKLTCQFRWFKLDLRCQDGTYFLNGSKVLQAYHLEVEEGPVPLVFKAKGMELTVLIQEKLIEAELVKNRISRRGKCI